MGFLSYRQIIELFKTAADNTIGINNFVFGAPWEIQQTYNLNYPIISFEISNLITINQSSKQQTIVLYFLDIPLEGAGGERRIDPSYNTQAINTLSKMEQKVYQYLNQIFLSNTYLRNTTYTMTPVIENFADRTWGWRVEFTIQLPFKWSVCEDDSLYLPLPCSSTGVNLPSYYIGPNDWAEIGTPRDFDSQDYSGIVSIDQQISAPNCLEMDPIIDSISDPTHFNLTITNLGIVDNTYLYNFEWTLDADWFNSNPTETAEIRVLFSGCCDDIFITFIALNNNPV